MKSLLFITLLALTLCAEEEPEFPIENDVTILTDATFEKCLEKNEFLMVLFYAPWCGHCKKFKPEYEKAAASLRKENLILAKVDATAEKVLAGRFKIRGYPTVKFFVKGEPIDYNAGRTEKEVINWVHKKTQPPTKNLDTVEDVEKFLKENPLCTIYFGKNAEDMKEFSKVALKNEDFPFATVDNVDVIKKYSKEGTVVLFKDFDEKKNEMTTVKEKDLEDFYKKYSMPRILKLNDKTIGLVFSEKFPAVMLFVKDDDKKMDEYDKIMRQVYDKVDGKVKTVLTSPNDGQSRRVAEYLGAKEANYPLVMLVDTRTKMKKYLMEGEITSENILKFVDDWDQVKLKPFLKTQEEPKENNGDVFVLVGKSFQKEVLDNDKDVMILLYAPWCGHCKKFHPTYEEIAKKLKEKNPKLLLTKMDATENEVEQISITSFPTIKFYPGDKKKSDPLSYSGDRSFDDVVKFIKTNAKTPIVYDEPKKEEDNKTSDL